MVAEGRLVAQGAEAVSWLVGPSSRGRRFYPGTSKPPGRLNSLRFLLFCLFVCLFVFSLSFSLLSARAARLRDAALRPPRDRQGTVPEEVPTGGAGPQADEPADRGGGAVHAALPPRGGGYPVRVHGGPQREPDIHGGGGWRDGEGLAA